jgi:hypothetical protein
MYVRMVREPAARRTNGFGLWFPTFKYPFSNHSPYTPYQFVGKQLKQDVYMNQLVTEHNKQATTYSTVPEQHTTCSAYSAAAEPRPLPPTPKSTRCANRHAPCSTTHALRHRPSSTHLHSTATQCNTCKLCGASTLYAAQRLMFLASTQRHTHVYTDAPALTLHVQ